MNLVKVANNLIKSNGFVKYGKNTIWLLSEKIVRLLSGLLIGTWVANYLGPGEYGLYNYAVSIATLFASIASLGLDGILVRELLNNKNEENIIFTSFVLKLIGATVSLILIIIFLQIRPESNIVTKLIIIMALSTFFQSFSVIDVFFQSVVKSRYTVISNITSIILSSVLKVILIMSASSLIAFAWVLFAEKLIAAVWMVYFFYKDKANLYLKNLKFSKLLSVSLLKDSWLLIFSAISITLYMKMDQIFLMNMVSEKAVGEYVAATRLSELWYFIPLIISSSLFPAIINAKKRSQALYLFRIQKLYNLMVLLALLVCIPITLFGKFVIDFLYGIEYHSATPVLMIHIWAGIFVFLGVASSKWLINENLQSLVFKRTLFGGFVNLGLNLILIPHWGAIGAAVATLIGQLSANYLFDLFGSKTIEMFKMKTKALILFWDISLEFKNNIVNKKC
ncbi:flippase [Aestuariibaculum lutulentum]|uniref:Flippase n=1 Tax=Aestuariibaculum lutulentum TaxID=2920935 RepID=A0ABS9RGN8_9FLAO|nr:flippase [Aestuariibaculum lutulentum]MCH4552111.1 flippase [Aestuariibaculum lutulentum]